MWYIFAAIAAFAVLILAILLLIPVRIILTLTAADPFSVSLKIKIASYTFEPAKKKTSKSPKSSEISDREDSKNQRSSGERITSALKIFGDFSEDIKAFVGYAAEHAARFESIRFHLAYSTGDAALTGILCGAVNAALYSLLGIIHSRTTLQNADINILPQFSDAALTLDSECILRIKNAHIIVIAIKLLRLIKKIRKNKG